MSNAVTAGVVGGVAANSALTSKVVIHNQTGSKIHAAVQKNVFTDSDDWTPIWSGCEDTWTRAAGTYKIWIKKADSNGWNKSFHITKAGKNKNIYVNSGGGYSTD